MPSPFAASVVIACPRCGTRYQLAAETIGPGRKVSCAHCGTAWHAMPAESDTVLPFQPHADDRLFEEDRLDADFEAEAAAAAPVPEKLRRLLPAGDSPPPEMLRTIAEIQAAISPKREPVPDPGTPAPSPDDAAHEAARLAFIERQAAAERRSVRARLKRTFRAAAVTVLLLMVAGGIGFRRDIVAALPDLAGLYDAVGLSVNVVGLEFSNMATVNSRRTGVRLMRIEATIRSVADAIVAVPPVLVTVVDPEGKTIYEWRVTPAAPELAPGETLAFSTELSAPPPHATAIRLSFSERPGSASRVGAAPAASTDLSPETAH